MPVRYTESVRITRTIVQTAARAGADPGLLMAKVGLNPEVLDNHDARVPAFFHLALLTEGVALSGDEALGIHLGEWLEPDPADVIWYIFLNCETVGDAAERAERYYKVISDVAWPKLEVSRNEARIVMTTGPRLPVWPAQAAEAALSIWTNMLRKLGGERLRFREVRFQHEKPRDLSEHERYFQAELNFDQARNELVLEPELLRLPNAYQTPDMHLLHMLSNHAERQLAAAAPVADFMEELRLGITETLRGGRRPTLKTAAAGLGISTRTLQRRLEAQGSGFSMELDAVRRTLAMVYLEKSSTTANEIAFLLAYSSPETFNRAFRRWHGVAPSEYRKRTGA